jgi:hypothetical protein
MAKPLKLRDFLQRLKECDSSIEVLSHRGKGSHLMLCKTTDVGKLPYPIPTSSGEVAGPYQKAVIRLFGLPDSDEWFKTVSLEDGYYVKTSQPHLVLDYAAPEMTDKLPSTCFFFVDFNYDGKKELVLTEFANGQRLRNTYQVYAPDVTGVSKSNMTTGQEPFASLDSESKIDFKDRTIRLFNSGGANLSEQLLYKFDESLGHYSLIQR